MQKRGPQGPKSGKSGWGQGPQTRAGASRGTPRAKIKLHTDLPFLRRDVMSLAFRRTILAVCNRGNLPAIADSINIIPHQGDFVNIQ